MKSLLRLSRPPNPFRPRKPHHSNRQACTNTFYEQVIVRNRWYRFLKEALGPDIPPNPPLPSAETRAKLGPFCLFMEDKWYTMNPS